MLQLLTLKPIKARLLALLVLLVPVALHAQTSTNNMNEDFTGASTNNSWFFFNGACLTAGQSTTATSSPGQIPSCISIQSSYYQETLTGGANGFLGSASAPASPDPVGQGALRFTNGFIKTGYIHCVPGYGGYCQNGAVVSAVPFPTGQGLSVTFKTVAYRGNSGGTGGDGADGISFYLLDGCMPITGATLDSTDCAGQGNPASPLQPNPVYGSPYGSVTYPAIGAWGGSLAYSCSNGNAPYNGLVGAYLGVGIDEYGNFLNGANNTLGETGSTQTNKPYGDNTATGGYFQPGRIGLRGAGSISFQALNAAYGTDPGNRNAPYYPSTLATTCTSGGVYSNGSCGSVCPTGYSYDSNNNTCDQCASTAGTFSTITNQCMTCPNGATYDVANNTCSNPAFTCPNGATYSNGSCGQAYFCSTSGYTLFGSNCLKCSSGTLNTSTGVGYCDNICPTGYTYEATGQKTYPQVCYKCSNGNTNLTESANVWSCKSSGTISFSNEKQATSTAATANTPQAVLPTGTAPATKALIATTPYALLAVQNTCRTGNLYNYSQSSGFTADAPSAAGTATLPSDPTNPNQYNTAGILDYPALFAPGPPLVGAYSVLPGTVKIAKESAMTRPAATPIFYNLKISQDGKLTLNYSVNGGAYTPVIKNLDITQSNGPIPASLRFGFAGSTGDSSNIHEIMCFKAAPDTVSASSVGVNEKQSQQIQPDTQAFFAYYDPVDSTGRVAAFGVGFFDKNNPTQLDVSTVAAWDASCNLTGTTGSIPCPTTNATGVVAQSSQASGTNGRQVLTWNGTSGVAFEWTGTSTVSGAQQTALGSQNALSFLRGDRSNEITSKGVGTFRARDSVLADIIDSSPTWVGAPSSGYTAAFADRINSSDPLLENASTSTTYVQFKSTYQSRQNIVYDGANDGMLHAFRTAADDGTGLNDGMEVLAYMPNYVSLLINQAPVTSGITDYSRDFSSPQYSHNYFVDATPGTGDLFFSGKWHTWLVGGLGAGGPAIYALDITDPSKFAEGNAASLVIGEWTTGTDATAGAISCAGNGASNNVNCGQNLGNTYGTPLIRRLHNGDWGVIFGNGLGSSTGDAGIYVMDISATTGAATFYYLSTGQGTATSPGSDGIAAAAAVDLDNDKTIDYVYAGDVLGNLWRFDLTSGDPTKWAAGKTPLFSSPGQPITSIPIVGGVVTAGGFKRVMVAFGTGQRTPMSGANPITYLNSTQYLYGVWDWNMGAWNSLPNAVQFAAGSATGLTNGVVGPTNLQAQTVKLNTDGTTRDITASTVCFQGASDCGTGKNVQFGWSVQLIGTSSQGTEQIVSNPTFLNGTIQWNSILPADNQPTSCTQNTDKGWTYDVTLAAGAPVPKFFQQYYDDSLAGGVETDASGTSFLLNAANGSSWLVYQTVTNQHETMQVNLPANNSAKRLTWIQLR